MRLAAVTTDIRAWNGEHRERDGERDATRSNKVPESVQVDDGGAAFTWSLIARLFRMLKTRGDAR